MTGICAPPKFGTRISSVIILATIVLLAVMLRLHTLDRTTLDWDEDLYRAYAQDLLAGKVLYRDLWDHKPPGIFYLFAFFKWIHPSIAFFRSAAIAWGVACGLVLYAIAVRLWGREAGWVAFLAWTLATCADWGAQANAELFFTLFTLLGVLAFTRLLSSRDGPAPGTRWGQQGAVVCGILCGVGYQFKPVAAADFCAILLCAMFFLGEGRRRSAAFGLLGGFLAPNLIVLAWSIRYGITGEWLYAVYTYNVRYVAEPMAEVLSYGPRNLADILRSQAALLALAGAGLVFLRVERRREVRWFLLLWVVLTFFSVSLGLKFLKHYFLQWLAPVSLLAGLAFHAALARLGSGRRARVAAVAMAALFAVWAGNVALARGSDLAQAVDQWQSGTSGDTSSGIADFLKRKYPGRSVYVWRSPYLGVYFLSGARPGTRFLFWRHLTRRPLVEWMEDEWERSIRQQPPDLIVNSDRNALAVPAAPFMEAMMQRRYARVVRSSRFAIYQLVPDAAGPELSMAAQKK